MPPEYEFVVSEDKTSCKIYLASGKYIGEVVAAPGGRSLQNFAPDVMWLPVYEALGAMGAMTPEQVLHGILDC